MSRLYLGMLYTRYSRRCDSLRQNEEGRLPPLRRMNGVGRQMQMPLRMLYSFHWLLKGIPAR